MVEVDTLPVHFDEAGPSPVEPEGQARHDYLTPPDQLYLLIREDVDGVVWAGGAVVPNDRRLLVVKGKTSLRELSLS